MQGTTQCLILSLLRIVLLSKLDISLFGSSHSCNDKIQHPKSAQQRWFKEKVLKGIATEKSAAF